MLPIRSTSGAFIQPAAEAISFGVLLSTDGTFDYGYDLSFFPQENRVQLNQQQIFGVEGLTQSFKLEIVMQEDIIDVCIDKRRTVIDQCPERKHDGLILYAHHSEVVFEILESVALDG